MSKTENKYKVDKFNGMSIILWEKGIKDLFGETRFFDYSFKNTGELLFYFYCVLYSTNKFESTMTFEDFVNDLDNNQIIINEFIQDYQKYMDIQLQFMNKEKDNKSDKKKVKQVQD